jgi:2-polyprenyl-3-methyl-5-hydroxy-6-metoxy-1,4-benzoquinol methylase
MEAYLYPHFYKIEKEHWWFIARQKILLDYLDHHLRTSKETRILDVGCGTGAILEVFAQQFNAYGIDSSKDAIDFCRQRGLSNLFVGSLESYPSKGKFDIITMLDVAEHVKDDLSLFQQAHDLLKSGGSILVAVPAFPFLWSQHDVILHHTRRYTKTQLRKVVASAGFTIQHMTFFNTLLFPIAVVKRILQPRNADDLEIPGRFLNTILKRTFMLERVFVPRASLPFGLSLLCLAKTTAS